jgi:lysophospholipase L1-like esterase
MRRIRQDGFVYGAKAVVGAASQAGQIKFKVFRKNGANYDFVGQSELMALEAGGGTNHTVTFTFGTPIPCKIGDYFGYSTPPIALNDPRIMWGAENGGTPAAEYSDVVTSNAFGSEVSNYFPNIEALTCPPLVAITGDSISAGYGEHKSFYNIEQGSILHDPGYQLQQLIPDLLYQNHGKGSMGWNWVRTTGMVSALASKPKYLIVHAGINDAATSEVIATILSDMDLVLAACVANNTELILDEITPATNQNDVVSALARSYNSAYATWCATNHIKMVSMHDIYGKLRVSTGELDDLIDIYNGDTIHYSLAGKQKMAELWKQRIQTPL